MSVQIGSLAIVGGINTKFSEAPSQGQKAILIGNESGLTCTITMEGGNVSKTLYPSTVDWFAVKPGFSGTIKIAPTALLNNVATWPSSTLIFDAIGLDDPEQASMYPISLNRNNNIGNSVSTTGGSTTSVTNDNQALTPSNVFIEATPSNAPGSTISIATDGTVTIKGDVANVLKTLLQLIPGAAAGASSVILSDATRQTEVLGTLLVDGAETITGASTFTGDATFNGAGTGVAVTNNETVGGTLGITGLTTATGGVLLPNNIPLQSKDAGGTIRSLLLEDGSNNIIFNAGNQNFYQFNNNNNTARVRMDTGDVNPLLDISAAVATALKLVTGSLTGIKKSGPFTLSTTGVLCAHGLGVIPDFVIPVNDAGSSAGAIDCVPEWGSMDATNVKIRSASGAPVIRLLAIKF